jgi:hypothetical protein
MKRTFKFAHFGVGFPNFSPLATEKSISRRPEELNLRMGDLVNKEGGGGGFAQSSIK